MNWICRLEDTLCTGLAAGAGETELAGGAEGAGGARGAGLLEEQEEGGVGGAGLYG